MRSRPARLALSALAWIALGAAAFFTVHTQQQVDQRRASLRLFESSARDAADALDDVQAGQQAYVALGQDAREWSAKVATFLQTAGASIDTLRATALSPLAGPSLLDASTALTELGNIDTRAREQLAADDGQGASLTIFSAAADAVDDAGSNVEAALGAERQAADDYEAQQRRAALYAAGGGVGFAALALLLLAIAAPAARAADADASSEAAADASVTLSGLSRIAPAAAQASEHPAPQTPTELPLQPLADICTGFGRVRDAGDLKALLEQASDLMHARGVIVWLGSTAGADLRPVLAHGYSDATLARIPTLSRLADNAAATAYRTGEVQIVRSRPGASQGTIVAPLLAADGCIGALTAEIRDRDEERETTRVLAVILAAQLAGVLAAAADAPAHAAGARSAAG